MKFQELERVGARPEERQAKHETCSYAKNNRTVPERHLDAHG